jgi:hypothetical protein
VAWAHLGSRSDAENPVSMEIPSIEIVELGMTGFLATRTRTAIGLASNQPGFRYDDVLQAQDTFTHAQGTHLIKAGFDVRHQYMKSLFLRVFAGCFDIRRSTRLSPMWQRPPVSTSPCQAGKT